MNLMHRTDGRDPEFEPAVYGEIWVRVFDKADDEESTQPTWRHFHVSPQSGLKMTVEEAVSNVEVLNESEGNQSHKFEYYAVEVQLLRSVATPTTVADNAEV